jgi:phosphatidylethanolamine/phosphatidyl-N-methylethanolamine N-methyltransferase
MRSPGIRKALALKFDDELRFLRGWIHGPKNVGSIVPTSSVMARRMASVIDTTSGLPVLEVGPGTGVITRAILDRGVPPQDVYALEYSSDFVRHLRQRFPGVNVVQGDAFALEAALGPQAPVLFDCVVSSLPLLNFRIPQRIAYLEALLSRIPSGRPVIQFSYGPKSPIPPGLGDYTVTPFDFVFRNVPPARLWTYRRHGPSLEIPAGGKIGH